jgi:hypothetical protein
MERSKSPITRVSSTLNEVNIEDLAHYLAGL